MLAVSYYPVRHSCEVKPYSIDLLVAVILLLLGIGWLLGSRSRLRRIGLIGFLPLALGASFPSVFVASGIFVALLASAIEREDRSEIGWLGLYMAVLLAAFLAWFRISEVVQLGAEGHRMAAVWRSSFPPASPVKLLRWLLAVHTGNLMAYPVGGRHAGSVVTTGLFLVGSGCLIRRRRWSLLTFLLAPFAMTLIAASLHRYPYGGSARVSQHLAPAICLLAGLGIVVTLQSFVTYGRGYHHGLRAVMVLFVAIAVGGMAHDLWKPYRTVGDERVRQIVDSIFTPAANGAVVVVTVLDLWDSVPSNFQWYLGRRGTAVSWSGKLDFERLRAGRARLWVVGFQPRPETAALIVARLNRAGLRYHPVKQFSDRMLIGRPELPLTYVEASLWQPE
jgi:hypothetical protein